MRRKTFSFIFNNKRKRGFSLVETTLSLGIFSSGFILVLLLLTNASRTIHSAQSRSTSALIAEEVADTVQAGATPPPSSTYNLEGRLCLLHEPAAYTVYAQLKSSPTGLSNLVLRIVPAGYGNQESAYAVTISQP